MGKVKDKPLKKEILEKIADDTYVEIMRMDESSRPDIIYFYNANPSYLVKITLCLQDKLKKEREKLEKKDEGFKVYSPEVFIGYSENGDYAVDVGHYLRTKKISEWSCFIF